MKIRKELFGILSITLVVFLLNSCEKSDQREEDERIRLKEYLVDNGYSQIEPTSSGLYHVILLPGNGPSPENSDFIRITFTASLINGTIFETSDEEIARSSGIFDEEVFYGPTKFMLGDLNSPSGLKEGLGLMKEKGKSRMIIPSNLAFGSIDFGLIPPYSTLIYDIELLDVISDPVAHEQGLLESYLQVNDITVLPTSLGVYYIEIEEGVGETPLLTSVVTLHITGSLLDGRVFYSSEDSSTGPLDVNLTTSNFLPAILDGIMSMRKNGKLKIIVPWDQGYGEEGSRDGVIPPYSTIIFEIELLEITNLD